MFGLFHFFFFFFGSSVVTYVKCLYCLVTVTAIVRGWDYRAVNLKRIMVVFWSKDYWLISSDFCTKWSLETMSNKKIVKLLFFIYYISFLFIMLSIITIIFSRSCYFWPIIIDYSLPIKFTTTCDCYMYHTT